MSEHPTFGPAYRPRPRRWRHDASREIDWAALGQAAWTSVAIGLGVMLVAGVAVTSSLRAQDARASGARGRGARLRVVTIAAWPRCSRRS